MIPVFPTTYFGSFAYFKELAKYGHVLIEGKETYPKQSYRNRMDITMTDGVLSLSVPVKKPNGSKTITEDILVSSDTDWRRDHWKSIVSAYNPSPFFEYYSSEIEELIFKDSTSLLEFNQNILERVCLWLDMEMTFEITKDFSPIQENDFRLQLGNKNVFKEFEQAPYIQVFPGNKSWTKSVSILDAIMCEGPMTRNLLISRKD
jgi:hypothetical protein